MRDLDEEDLAELDIVTQSRSPAGGSTSTLESSPLPPVDDRRTGKALRSPREVIPMDSEVEGLDDIPYCSNLTPLDLERLATLDSIWTAGTSVAPGRTTGLRRSEYGRPSAHKAEMPVWVRQQNEIEKNFSGHTNSSGKIVANPILKSGSTAPPWAAEFVALPNPPPSRMLSSEVNAVFVESQNSNGWKTNLPPGCQLIVEERFPGEDMGTQLIRARFGSFRKSSN